LKGAVNWFAVSAKVGGNVFYAIAINNISSPGVVDQCWHMMMDGGAGTVGSSVLLATATQV
jgi:hypothetical protein